MQRATERIVIMCATELCAVLGYGEHKRLGDNACDYITTKGFSVAEDRIITAAEKNVPARVFYGNRADPTRIEKVNFIKELLRKAWLFGTIVYNCGRLSVQDIQRVIADKYREEKSFEEDLSSLKFLLFNVADEMLTSDEQIEAAGEALKPLEDDLKKAVAVLGEIFDGLPDLSYMGEIYNAESAFVQRGTRAVGAEEERRNKQKETSPADRQDKKEVYGNENLFWKEKLLKAQKTETALRDDIRVLESEKHDLELKVSHAKKDAVRDLLRSLTDEGWGAPLGELYLISRDDGVSEKIKGVIKNLFNALGSEDIKLVKENEVGKTVTLDENNQQDYDPYKNERIYLSDELYVCYPGFRFGREVMIRPIVKKKSFKEE